MAKTQGNGANLNRTTDEYGLELGKRLIPTIIDNHAKYHPDKIYAHIPEDPEILSKGFQKVTYAMLANAINKAARWLEDQLGPSDGTFETAAYVGPKDLVYPILVVAAMKCGRKVSSVLYF